MNFRKTIGLFGMALGLVSTGAFAQDKLPDGKVAIHYSRCDNNYDGWGLHLWKNPGIPLPGVEWAKPMNANGKTEFGIAWVVDLADFGKSGTVNYIIHKGETKEQGGRDMKFDALAHKEVWILSGDRKIYYSLDDATKGRAETPCK